MNTLLLGNGFDLLHGFPTKYSNAYYAAVNSLLAIGNNKVGVIAAMCLIRTVLWAVNRQFF